MATAGSCCRCCWWRGWFCWWRWCWWRGWFGCCACASEDACCGWPSCAEGAGGCASETGACACCGGATLPSAMRGCAERSAARGCPTLPSGAPSPSLSAPVRRPSPDPSPSPRFAPSPPPGLLALPLIPSAGGTGCPTRGVRGACAGSAGGAGTPLSFSFFAHAPSYFFNRRLKKLPSPALQACSAAGARPLNELDPVERLEEQVPARPPLLVSRGFAERACRCGAVPFQAFPGGTAGRLPSA